MEEDRDGQQAYENTIHFIYCYESTSQNDSEISATIHVWYPSKTPGTSACRDKENRNLLKYWWGCKLVHPLWKTVENSQNAKRIQQFISELLIQRA